MNYEKLYKIIIENAKEEYKNGQRFVGYYETHHILPKSLGGTNDVSNLVKLTPREHFICHWLLVKMYDKGTNERKKMLYAFWIMRNNPTEDNERYVNSKAYEKLRIEFAKNVGEMNKHFGTENGQYGKHWYTNRDTGESKSFSTAPDEKWVLGRNLFRGESKSIKNKLDSYFEQKNRALELWNEFKNGNYSSVNEFSKNTSFSQRYISGLFKTHIKEYIIGKGNHKNKSNA